jgi:hypothetical protein
MRVTTNGFISSSSTVISRYGIGILACTLMCALLQIVDPEILLPETVDVPEEEIDSVV